jgi:hypothetical protein
VTVGVQAKTDGSVFITQEELMDREMRRMLREEKKKQAAAAKLARLESAKEAKQLGRELASKAKIDHRYYVVRSLRANRPTGRELNRQSEGSVDKVLENGFLSGGDERWLRNYNIHNLETQSNITCSFNPRTGFCYTCSGEPHRAMQGRGGEAVAFVLADQSFPANVPAVDEGECLRIVRVEDGSVQELTTAFLELVKRRMVKPGSLVMLGSLTQLARVGTAFYISEWCKGRDRILRDLGDVLVVPWLPLLSEAAVGRHVVRCVAEFLDWFDNLQDPEASMLRALRREFCCTFMPQNGEGEKYGDILQNFMLPISLNSEGLTLYKSRRWGDMGNEIRMVDEAEEMEWLLKISAEINSLLRLSLATAVSGARTLSAVRAQEDGEDEMEFRVVGASNAARTAAALTRKGEKAEKVGKRGWSLAIEEDVDSLIGKMKDQGMQGKVLILHCMDNGSFFSLSRSGVSSLPTKKDRQYHIPGKLVVATGYTLENMVEQMLRIVRETGPDLAFIVMWGLRI